VNGASTVGGIGGAGVDLSALVGTGVGDAGRFAGGGGAACCATAGTRGIGGVGGGGSGGKGLTGGVSTSGTVNTGGGGGGGGGDSATGAPAGSTYHGQAGGTGMVLVGYTPVTAPGVPTAVSSPAQTGTTLDLQWSAPSTGGSVTSYQVRIDGGSPSTATSPHTFTGLSPSTSHTLEVRAVGPGGNSAYVSVIVSTVAPPNVPTAVSSPTQGPTTLDLQWSAPSGGGAVTSYQVRIDGGSPSTATSPHTFTGLSPSTSHTLEVRAVGPGGNSAYVSVIVSTTPPVPAGYYGADITVGAHSWSITSEDEPTMGPVLPLRLGWTIADQVDYFPAQANTALSFRILCQDASELADVVEGTTVTLDFYVESGGEPWQHFDGIVTQLDGQSWDIGQESLAFMVTVYAAEDMQLNRMHVGWSADWPEESQLDRLTRVCAEALVTLSVPPLFSQGLEGTMPAREAGGAMTLLQAVQQTLADAALLDDSSDPMQNYYGRPVYQFRPWSYSLAVTPFWRRVYPDHTTVLDGDLVEAGGSWSKLPVGAAGSWVLIRDTVFGTPSGPPIVRNYSLAPSFDTAGEVDRLGESLLPDGSTQLDGWYARTLRYRAGREEDVANLDLTSRWASFNSTTEDTGTNLVTVKPVVITPLDPDYELQGVDYVAGTLTGCSLVVPPGGDFYLELRLRPELLTGTDLP
jgi:hypothetical protein